MLLPPPQRIRYLINYALLTNILLQRNKSQSLHILSKLCEPISDQSVTASMLVNMNNTYVSEIISKIITGTLNLCL